MSTIVNDAVLTGNLKAMESLLTSSPEEIRQMDWYKWMYKRIQDVVRTEKLKDATKEYRLGFVSEQGQDFLKSVDIMGFKGGIDIKMLPDTTKFLLSALQSLVDLSQDLLPKAEDREGIFLLTANDNEFDLCVQSTLRRVAVALIAEIGILHKSDRLVMAEIE